MSDFEEIEEQYNLSIEEETKKFNNLLSTIKDSKERTKLEAGFKNRINGLIKEYSSGVSKFIRKNGAFYDSSKKDKKKVSSMVSPYTSKHLDLRDSFFDRSKHSISLFLFKTNLKIKKFFRLLFPSFVLRFFYKTKFLLISLKFNFFRFFRVLFLSIGSFFDDFWRRLKKYFFVFFSFFKKYFYKFFRAKSKEKSSDLLEENRKRIEGKL